MVQGEVLVSFIALIGLVIYLVFRLVETHQRLETFKKKLEPSDDD
jgi:flagellar biogenesis protein FliO